ncbi:LuxR family transcriptional regulator [Mycobacterium sp. 236(2023)]|uniref:helix-turn-helix transcriptional regulator n=1 Tax=Mycobacterium sp. 236(2023) TaxID=3038163 RepID=UPI0024150F9D|nr:LuxR family transcriptional regulator [Mycobacterium sp. 236(2023)]MDG4665298.1 LuxR C-terminal-related transcriptional regulator [Mycobacterium sp. 236(2023)]
MPHWPFVARSDEVSAALTALHAGKGVVLRGEAGVGKTTLARFLADALESEGWTKRSVLGTQTGRSVPLAAFNNVVRLDTAHEPAVMLAVAYRELIAAQHTVLVVDDAQYLDSLSALLIQQLAMDGPQRLIVTARSDVPVSDAVSALWKENLLQRLDIGAFTKIQTGEVLSHVTGDNVDESAVDEFYRLSAGSPLLLRGLVTDALADGTLAARDGRWRLGAQLPIGNDVSEIVEARLASLAPPVRDVIEIVSTAEVLDWTVLHELCSETDISAAERSGGLQLVREGAKTLVQVGHPIIGEVVRKNCGSARIREINTRLAQSFSHRPREDVRTTIALAQFIVRSDAPPDVALVLDAAQNAVKMADLVLGEELARFALDHGGELRAAIALADALSWQGRGAEAEALLAGFDPDGTDAEETLMWGCLRAANLYFGCGHGEAAREVLALISKRVARGTNLTTVAAMQASFAYFDGEVATATAVGLAALKDSPSPSAAAWAAMATAGSLALSGHFDGIAEIVDIGSRAAQLSESGPQRYALGLAEVLAHTASADLAAADQVCRRYAATTSGVPQAEAIVSALLGRVELTRGSLNAACRHLEKALWTMSGSLPAGWVMLAAAWLAQAEGGRGDATAADRALRKAEQMHGPQVAVFEPELVLARCWVDAANGETTTAREHASRAARIARMHGMSAVEMGALHTAVRLGDRSQAPRLSQLARTVNYPLPEAMSLHARALADRNGDALDDVAERFQALGTLAMAVDAAAHAAREHARRGARVKELESSLRAHWLASQGGIRTPATDAVGSALPITDREREIATLVGGGLTNRQVAERLGVSVRTIDGHLYRIFTKLGLEDRSQLSRLLRGDSNLG